MSESPGPGGDAENMNDVKSARIRSAHDDDGVDAVPPKTKKVDTIPDDINDEDENPLDEDNEFEDDDIAQEEGDTDLGEEEDDVDEEEDDEEEEEEDIEDNLEENQLDETGESSDLDEFIQSNLADIEGCQADIESLNKKANDEILKVEQKYNKLRQPVYARRNTYINKIPNFWVTVFSRHPQLKRVLSKDDIKCLQHLTNLQVDDFEDSRSGYRIKFSFSKNQWFSNPLITKEYHMPYNDPPSCACTSISWYPGMNLTKTHSSFFSWFCPQDDASTDDIAEIIREELWPSPLQFYMMKLNGEVESGESDDDEEAVYIEDDDEEEEDAEYISSEEEEYSEYRRPPAFGKEAPSSSRNYVDDEEANDYEEEEDLVGEDGSEDDSRPDPSKNITNNDVNHDVTSSDDYQLKENSQISGKSAQSAFTDAPDDVTTTAEGET